MSPSLGVGLRTLAGTTFSWRVYRCMCKCTSAAHSTTGGYEPILGDAVRKHLVNIFLGPF